MVSLKYIFSISINFSNKIVMRKFFAVFFLPLRKELNGKLLGEVILFFADFHYLFAFICLICSEE